MELVRVSQDFSNNEFENKIGVIYDDVATVIKKTNNYSKFSNILGNRDLRTSNYNKLIKSMQEKQLVIPILCNEKFEIINGQHRFESCKELNYPLYYYVVEGYNIDDVKRANMVSCNWVIDDYLKLNIEVGRPNYIKFKEIKDSFNISTTQLLDIFSKFQGTSLKESRVLFEDGLFEINAYNEVIEFLNNLEDFVKFEEYKSYSFIKAFLKMYLLPEYSHKTMSKRLKKQIYKLEKKANYRSYVELLVDIYNYGTTNVRFGYDSRQDRFYKL